MLTGDVRTRVDRIWNDFWSGGIANPLEVMEQITYLLFIKRLDDLQTLKERKANRLGEPVEAPVFPEGSDDKGRSYAAYRWSAFKDLAPAEMFTVVGEHVFPYVRTLGGDGSTYATTCATPASRSRRRACCRRRSTVLMRSPWRTATPRVTSTSTC